ncbi:cupin domain-containing protein [Natronogracilivirga saccharolytica]|uniref:Cupin domain-containing protein n=1 Tax=Natronogracilivirga saccharolytica TaxID=2812953 RepID=A0A8J7RGB5_9BACT|nr:cupin domain-containing protein [Natronogracilivirga saccharolytica]MBP3191365.1 cupin domain-containing protein [Natronogracilivirga saccharolytica]
MADQSKIIRNEEFNWPGIQKKKYKPVPDRYDSVTRYVLLGENDDEQGLNFQTRYFEIGTDGYSSLERHRHPHTVIIVRGEGSMILGNEYHQLDTFDTVYIAPETVHQFHADRGSPLGFICIVDRYRDRPEVPASRHELKSWIPDPDVRNKARL